MFQNMKKEEYRKEIQIVAPRFSMLFTTQSKSFSGIKFDNMDALSCKYSNTSSIPKFPGGSLKMMSKTQIQN